ncbi:MAG TPA: lamin tail domain-containing protein, partial [Balneolaceae bacterium]|nr:lamin tail domain-containing protein [Balneolaceae bacterium]
SYKFGTPGSANNVPPDNEPPALTGLNSVDAANLQLIFSEKVTNASATDISHYHIAPSRNIQLISVHNDSVTLLLGSPLTSGETYDITISGLSDIFGNTLSTVTKQLKFVKIDKAQPGDVLLNEIMYNPAPDEADFVELYNPTGKNFDLTNWFIGDATGTSQIKKSVILPPDRYLILTGNRAFAQKFDNAVVVSDFPALNNNRGDAVYIRRNDRTTIDSLYYSQSWGGSQEGTSIERKDPFDASNDASNWTSSSSDDHYSAGEQNISFQSDTHPPKIVFAKTLTGGHLEVRFNEFIRLTENLGFSTDGQALTITGFDSTQGNIIDLQGGTTKLKGKHTTLTAKNVSDVKGNMKASAKIPIARPLQPKELTINEIMYDPLNQTDDNNPDQSEYIELRNTRDYAISLEGLSLHDAPDEKSNITILEPVTSTAKWVPARGYVLIYAENTATKFKQSKVANFFDLKSTNMRSIMRVDRAGLGLASEGDAIYLADSSGTTIDSVYYDKSWQNPNLIDTRGIALERINPEGPSNDQSNWGSSVTIKGGTPDKKNSIYQANPDKPSKIGISFDPNPFSPDNDGYQDNLFINYKLDQPDYLIRVRIYDRYGRLVRKLADGKPAGFDGQLIWDGRKNDDNRNRIGIYIVVFEAYNSATGSDKSFKKPIVLARKLN